MILVMFCLFAAIKNKEYKETLNIPLKDWTSDYIEYENGGWQIGADWLNTYGTTVPLLYGPFVELPKGDYTVTIVYQCDTNQSFSTYANEPDNRYIKGGTAILDKCSNVMSYDFRTIKDIDNFEFVVYYNGEGNFNVSQMTIQRNDNGIRRTLVYLLFLMAVVNLILWCKDSIDRKKYLLGIIAITVISSLPLFCTGLNDVDGQDLVFHLMRIEGIVKEIELGNIPVRIASAWLGEHGYPTSVYYGDILLYVPAVLRILGFSVNSAYKIFVFLINLLTVIISEYSFRKMLKKENISFVLTLVYLTSSYRLVDIYARSAVGEYIALVFFPLIMLAVYNIYTGEICTKEEKLYYATILAVGMTGVITAHVLSAELIAFAIILTCVCCLKRTIRWCTIQTLMLAVVETFCLSMFFIVPFVDYYLNESVKITYIVNEAATRTIQSKGCAITDYVEFFKNPFLSNKDMLLTPGIVLMLVLAITIVLWICKKARLEMKILLIITMLFVYMSTNMFPWDALAQRYSFFNLLAQVQFPWRYIGIISVLLTLLLGMLLLEADSIQAFEGIGKGLRFFCVIMSVLSTIIFTGYYETDAQKTIYYDTEELDTYYIMNGEYLRLGVDKHSLDGKIVTENVQSINVIARRGCSIDLACKTGENKGYVTVPVINYKGYVVRDDFGNEYEIEDGKNACISFYLPENYEGNFYLRYEEPWYWTAALVASFISAVVMVGFISKKK